MKEMLCCICGLKSREGVLCGWHTAAGYQAVFACTYCFTNPCLYFECKKPTWSYQRQTRIDEYLRV